MLLIMRYSDGADCCGCLCHHTTDYSDCYHEWSTRLNAMHTTCTALLPPVQVLGVGGATMWVHMGGIATWEAFSSAL